MLEFQKGCYDYPQQKGILSWPLGNFSRARATLQTVTGCGLKKQKTQIDVSTSIFNLRGIANYHTIARIDVSLNPK